jgi:hypothetical protein
MPPIAADGIDALIARTVLGWVPDTRVPGALRPPGDGGPGVPLPTTPPKYSTDIRAAWLLVDYLIEQDIEVAVYTTTVEYRGGGLWACTLVDGGPSATASAETAALAICRATLALRRYEKI